MGLLAKIAVEQSLQAVKDYLQNQGHEVFDLNQNVQADAYVISGQDKDVLGMQDVTTKASVLNAKGLTPEEVYQELSNRL
ncbi:YkuS family protein [Tepidibacillus marianensis]|uniref:YkuS family protein n=1 Tax=Tepidibacillus marianensis TaxID=3131995 RepID=UPI0030D2A86F